MGPPLPLTEEGSRTRISPTFGWCEHRSAALVLTHLPRLDDSARPSLGDLQSRTELRPIPFLTWHIVERVGLDSVLHFKSRKGLAPSLCEWVQKRQDPPPFRQPAPSFSCAKQNWGLPPGLDPWGLGRLLQSLGLSHKFGPLLQSVALTVAQGAELGNSPAITSVLYILFRGMETLSGQR